MLNPARSVRELLKLKVTDCYVMINDFSDKRTATKFSYRREVVPFADALNAAGIRVHLCSWIMPHEVFLRGMCFAMPKLIKRCKAVSVLWDAEEPWTLAKGFGTYARAVSFLARHMAAVPWGVPVGITGIGYAVTRKLKALAKLCAYLLPQAYSTRTSKVNCLTVASKFCKIWISKFGRKEIRVGLAGYRQKGVKGSNGTEADAMEKAILSVPREIDEVVYWWLPTLRREDDKAHVVLMARELHAEALAGAA